ncbi:MAG: thioester oxidase [Methanobacterium sp. BRmetb2]|nr:MAG: thioester oxidase [Methanobacterium sp. BRmetb2]
MKDSKKVYQKYRYFLKDSIRKTIDFSQTDQNRGITAPPLEKPYPKDAEKVNLIIEDWETRYDYSLAEAIKNRKSQRSFTKTEISLEELSFLLWATQGVRQVAGPYAFRNVPSAGCRHALETYLAVFNVEHLDMGVYRYLPLTHQLLLEFRKEDLRNEMITATFGQRFAGESAVTFIWTAIPYRMEWRYGLDSHKVIAMDAGHVGQNMYLTCEAIGAGTCTIGAYDQEYLDELLGVDGEDEFAIYLAAVGKKD